MYLSHLTLYNYIPLEGFKPILPYFIVYTFFALKTSPFFMRTSELLIKEISINPKTLDKRFLDFVSCNHL